MRVAHNHYVAVSYVDQGIKVNALYKSLHYGEGKSTATVGKNYTWIIREKMLNNENTT